MTMRQFCWRMVGQIAGIITAGGISATAHASPGSSGAILLMIGLGLGGIVLGHIAGSMPGGGAL